jgi:hypothetical protein
LERARHLERHDAARKEARQDHHGQAADTERVHLQEQIVPVIRLLEKTT